MDGCSSWRERQGGGGGGTNLVEEEEESFPSKQASAFLRHKKKLLWAGGVWVTRPGPGGFKGRLGQPQDADWLDLLR